MTSSFVKSFSEQNRKYGWLAVLHLQLTPINMYLSRMTLLLSSTMSEAIFIDNASYIAAEKGEAPTNETCWRLVMVQSSNTRARLAFVKIKTRLVRINPSLVGPERNTDVTGMTGWSKYHATRAVFSVFRILGVSEMHPKTTLPFFIISIVRKQQH